MAWWKKAILFILSSVFLIFTSCEDADKLSKEKHFKEEKTWTKKEIIAEFFLQVQKWDPHSTQLIDSLGNAITQRNSSLLFLPYRNEYEENAFIFAAANKNDFRDFEESKFLKQSGASEQSAYKVWRKHVKKADNHSIQLLDLSIEPHPTLHWVFVVRIRKQE